MAASGSWAVAAVFPRVRFRITRENTICNCLPEYRPLGETWHPKSSGDGTWEIILRNDLFDPVDVLGVQMNKLVHTVIPNDASHGRKFRAAALRVGLTGKIHKAEPGPLLLKRLAEISDKLGPLPHAALNIQDNPITTRPIERSSKKRGGVRVKAECLGCANEDKPYIVRLSAASARDPGPPHCPKHGAMKVEWPAEEEQPDEPDSASAAKERGRVRASGKAEMSD
jgi:hypothetical protein